MKQYIFTFGFGHHCRCGARLANMYVRVEAENYEQARKTMVAEWRTKWAFQYESKEEAGVEKFNLREVEEGHGLQCRHQAPLAGEKERDFDAEMKDQGI